MSTPDACTHRLERGEIFVAPCPDGLLPESEDLSFLMQQRLNSTIHKNISYNPQTDIVSGFVQHSPDQAKRLQDLLRHFSERACAWLAEWLPDYSRAWQPDRASLRTEEEATRKLRLTARNDLLHFDAFPSRPARGHRILRLYVNINPTDDRVWVTSDTFAKVLDTYGARVGLPTPRSVPWVRRLELAKWGERLLSQLFQSNAPERTEYDEFMLRLHHFLKTNDEFQERSPRRLWHFKPNTAWLLFSDAISHAELRGQYALEHSWFVAPETLALPEETPVALLQRKCGKFLPHAA